MVKVCVLGASGYVGYAVARAFACEGYQVYGTCRTADKAAELRQDEIYASVANLKDPSTYQSILAACAVIVQCAADFQDIQDTDRIITETINAACAEDPGKTVILLSGVWTYGSHAFDVIDESTEDDPPKLVAWRARHEESVLQNEAIKAAVVLRAGLAYGYGGSLTGTLMKQAQQGEVIFPGDGRNFMAMVHVDDLAKCFVRTVEANLSGAYVFVVAGSNEQVNEVLRNIAHVVKRPVTITYTGAARDAFSECLVMNQKVDASRARYQLGWVPKHRAFSDDTARYFDAFVAHSSGGASAEASEE